MIRSLQKKLIATALLSLSVLLILLISCIVTISYVEMERSADATLARLAQEEPQSPGPQSTAPFLDIRSPWVRRFLSAILLPNGMGCRSPLWTCGAYPL